MILDKAEVSAARIGLAVMLGLGGLLSMKDHPEEDDVRYVVRGDVVVLQGRSWVMPGSTCALRGIEVDRTGRLATEATKATRRLVADGVHFRIVGVFRDEALNRPGAYLCDVRDSRGRDVAVELVKAGLAIPRAERDKRNLRITLASWKAWALGRGFWH